MGYALFLIVSSLLIAETPISFGLGEISQKKWFIEVQKNHHDHGEIDSGIQLTLYNVHRTSSSSDLLVRDEARVQSFNYRRSILKSKTKIHAASTTSSNGARSTSRSSATAASTVLANRAKANSVGGGVDIGLNPGTSIGVANYYVKMGLGTPVKYYDMIVDTGSSLTWLQCKPCAVYCHPQAGPMYDPSTSTTHKYVPCSTSQCSALEAATLNAPMCSMFTNWCLYEASYGDRSYSVGYLTRDTMTLSSTSKPTLPGFVYGCGEDTQGLFGRSAGLIGFARNSLSLSAQLAPKYGFAFAYCLPTSSTPSSGSSQNRTGILTIGASSSYNYTKTDTLANLAVPYQFTPMITDPDDPSLYYLRWTGMTVSGKPLNGVPPLQYRETSTIIDSGTVISRLPTSVYTALRDVFSQALSTRYQKAPSYSILDTCYYNKPKTNTTNHQKELMMKMWLGVPKVSMIFQGGAELKLGPENVLLEVTEGVSCLAFSANSDTNGIAIIGNHQQKTYRIIYDVTNSKIGFAAGGCD